MYGSMRRSSTSLRPLSASTPGASVWPCPRQKRGTKVADCTPVIEVAELRDDNIEPDRPRRGSPEFVRNWPGPIFEMVNRSSVDLEDAQREALHELVDRHMGIFSLSPEDIGRMGLVQHQIHTNGARPVHQPARRLPWSKREEADEQVEKMLNAGSLSPREVLGCHRLCWSKRKLGPRVSAWTIAS